MRVRFVLIIMLALIFAGMLAVHAMAIANTATPAGEEYDGGSAGDQYLGTGDLGTGTTPVTPSNPGADNTGNTAGAGSAAGSVYSGASSLPSTGVFLLLPAAGLAATGLGALMMRKRGSRNQK